MVNHLAWCEWLPMNSNSNIIVPPIEGKPHTTGWLVGAIVFTLLALAPAAFVVLEWQEINEFTILVTLIPALLAVLLGFAALALWLVWILQWIRSRKYLEHLLIIRQISLDRQREQAEAQTTNFPEVK
jgi:hypothetical protein